MSKTALYIFLALTATALFVLTHFTLNVSASEPLGFYRVTHETLSRNRLVLLRDPLKRLVGLPGDEIRMTPEGIYVNGQLMPKSAVPSGSPYPHYPYKTFKLALDQYVVLGDNPLSWDSRYEGAIPASIVASVVEPTITW